MEERTCGEGTAHHAAGEVPGDPANIPEGAGTERNRTRQGERQ